MMDLWLKMFRCGVVTIAIALPLISRADTVELVDGSRIEVESPRFEDGRLVLDDGRVIPRGEIRRILFERGASMEIAPAGPVDSDVQELLARAAEAQARYPDVGAITLIDDGEFILHPDGTQLERSHYAVKILKEPWKEMGQISRAYTEGRERVRLVRARTISPEGKVQEFDPAYLKEAKPTGGMVFFDEYKTLSGQLPEVEIGSIVEVIWETETYNPYDRELFFPEWYFGGTEPSLSSRVVIRVPRERTLHYQVHHIEGEAGTPTITTEGDYRVYRWEMRDIEHIVPEPAMPPVGQVSPSLQASLFADWDYLFDFLGKFQGEHVRVTPELEAKVGEIIGDSTDPEEKLAKIYHWLQREIRYISIKGSMGSGWSGHPATLTLQNKYGDCIDKAILFAAMLKVTGIEAYPVIITTNRARADDRSLPTLYGNHAITKIYLDDEPFYLDSTATTYRYPYFREDDHGVTQFNVLEREIGFIEVPPPEDNRLEINADMTVDDQGNIEATVTLEMSGFIEARFRQGLEQLNKMILKLVAQQFINRVSPGATLETIETSDEKDLATPITVNMGLRFPEYPTFAGDLMIFKLPLSEMIHRFDEIALEERRFDIQYATSLDIRQRLRITLPEGYVPKGLPDPVRLETKYAGYEADYTVDGQTVVFEDRRTRCERVVPRDDYPDYKRFLEEVADFAKMPLFLYKIKEDPT